MEIHFTKMQGCGNDYLYVDCRDELPQQLVEAIPFLSHRNFGVGGDGVICICSSQQADATMRMFNADGSEGKMCGNGIRCVAQWLYEHGMKLDTITIETLSGLKTLHRMGEGMWQVDMGKANLSPKSLPAVGFAEGQAVHPLDAASKQWQVTLISMGNPHCVVQVEDTKQLPLPTLGPAFEHHPAFPEGVNTEFIRQVSPTKLEMRVWERGSGETLACGTGACAVTVASVLNGYTDEEITVHLLGGDLKIFWDRKENLVYMTGPAEVVFDGEIQL